MRHLAFALSLAVTASITSAAFAQTNAPSDEYGYRFDDDYMLGDTLGSPPPILKGPKHPLKVQLIRARTSFVGEMLKSVEAF
jgi:hypothetical protein